MKKILIISAFAISLYGCNSESASTETTATEEASPVVASNEYVVNGETSLVKWKGSMVGAYAHEGTVKIPHGAFTLENGVLTAGNFIVDLASIVTTDDDALYKMAPREKLIEHLQAPDFFDVNQFPTASFTVISADASSVTGSLTIKGVTKEVVATGLSLTESEGSVTATATLVFNRQDFGVSYKSAMKDMVLSDDIELTIELNGIAAPAAAAN